MVSFEDIWSNNSPWQRPIFISGVPGGTCIISSNFEIDTVKLDPLSDDLPEAVSAFLEKNTPNLVQFVHAIKASAYLDPIPKGLKAKVRNWEDLKGFTAADCRNHILNILGNNFTRADVSIRDGFHFSKADQSVDGPIPFGWILFPVPDYSADQYAVEAKSLLVSAVKKAIKGNKRVCLLNQTGGKYGSIRPVLARALYLSPARIRTSVHSSFDNIAAVVCSRYAPGTGYPSSICSAAAAAQ